MQGVTGQGADCCSANATTTLESFPYSTLTVIGAVSRSSTASSQASLLSSSLAISSGSSAIQPSSSGPTTTGVQNPSSTSATTAFAASSSKPAGPQPHSASHAVAIGVGVGVPVGLLLLAFLLYLLYRERRTKQEIHDLQEHIQKAERKSLEPEVPTFGAHENSKRSTLANHELDTGLDRGELTAGYGRHELEGRQRLEVS